MDSILTSIKKLLGVEEEYTQFDPDIIMSINTVLMSLNQIGVGPLTGFIVTGDTEKWSDYLGEAATNLEAVKTYIFLKVKLLFDPPSASIAVESIEHLLSEFEWRILLQVEGG